MHGTEVATLERRVLVAQTASRNDLTCAHGFAVAGIGYHLLAPYAVVLFREVELVYQFLFEESGVAWVVDLHLAHHLAHDNLEVLVVDFHTLQAVNVLHLVNDILLHSRGTLDGQNVVGRYHTIRKRRTSANGIVFLHQDLLGKADEILLLVARFRSDNDFAITTLYLTHSNLSIDFGDNGRVGGVACLEEFGNTGQTTRDVACTTHGTGNLNEGCTRLYLRTIFNHHVATHGEVVRTQHFAISRHDVASGHLRTVFGIGDNLFGKSCGFVGLCTEGNTFHHIVELQRTSIFGNDNGIEGVPSGNERTFLNHVAVLVVERRTVRNVKRREDDGGVGVDKTDFGQTANHHLTIAFAVFAIFYERHGAQFVELDTRVVLCHDRGVGGCITSHTTRVERTKG